MSNAQLEAFFQKVGTDTSLQEQIKSLTPGDADGLVKIASTSGFQFTVDEFRSVIGPLGRELSEDELGKVAGGSVQNFEPIYMNSPLGQVSVPVMHILIGL